MEVLGGAALCEVQGLARFDDGTSRSIASTVLDSTWLSRVHTKNKTRYLLVSPKQTNHTRLHWAWR